MKYKLQDLINIGQFQSLQDKLNKIYSFTTAILDNDGNILTASGWQEICTKFHRVNPESQKGCTISDLYILNHMNEANPCVSYKCLHGLFDSAFPIIIEGIHYGNFYIGQFLYEPPDIEFFKKQAHKFGFNEDEYLQALKKVPILTKEQTDGFVSFIKELIEVISIAGLKNLKEIETQKALQSTQALYHDLVETAQDLVWQCDVEGRYTYLNPAWEEVFGFKVDEMLGKKFTDFQTKECAKRDLKEFSRLLKGDTIKGLETVHIGKDGKEIYLIFNAKFVLDETGNVIGTRGTAYDVSIIRKIEKTLSTTEEKYLNLFNSMSEGVVLHELVYDKNNKAIDYKIINSNPAFERHTGIEAKLAKNKLASKFYNSSPAPYLDVYSKVAETAIPVHFETFFPPLKKHFDISVFSPRKGWFATAFTDITEQVQMHEKLKESELHFRSIVENTEAGYFFIDKEGFIRDVNKAWVELYKYNSPEEIIGKHFTLIQKIDDLETAKAFVDGIMQGNENFMKGEISRQCKDGSIGYHTFTARPVNKDNVVVGIEGFILDITKLKEAEEKLHDSQTELRAVLDYTPFPVAIVDTQDNNIFFWSRSALSLFGHTAPTASEWYEIAYPDPEYRKDVVKRWKPVLEKAQYLKDAVNTGEYRITCKDGTVRICELFAAFIGNRLIVTFNDITVRKNAEEKIKLQMEELKRFNATMIDRELRMIELKQEINELCNKLNLPDKYSIPTT